LKLDILEFIRAGQTASGNATLEDMPRLAQAITSLDQSVQWQVAGQVVTDEQRRKQDRLTVKLDARLNLVCSRCLEPMPITLSVVRHFWFVKDEATADTLDANQDEIDVLAANRQFDLTELLEDELLMALPPQSTHDVCEVPTHQQEPQNLENDKVSPFAALASLKKTM
jgi:uncharacterized protein